MRKHDAVPLHFRITSTAAVPVDSSFHKTRYQKITDEKILQFGKIE